MEDFAGGDDAFVDDAVVDVESIAAGLDEAIVAHEGKMLGEVCFGEFGDIEKFFNTEFAKLEVV